MYLLSQCFYPEYNHRTDEYGGCAENRFRIIREIFEEIKTVCSDKTPVFLKINGDDRDDTEEYHRDIVTVLGMFTILLFTKFNIKSSVFPSAMNKDAEVIIFNL